MTQTLAAIGVIGGGTMAEAIVRGAIRQQLVDPSSIHVGEPNAERRAYLENELGIRTYAANEDVLDVVKFLVLAVKPQVLSRVLEPLAGKCADYLILSIVAGATMKTIASGLGLDLGQSAIVRVMPNTPAQIGEGISVWTTSAGVFSEQKEMAGQLLSALGEQIYVEKESYLDMATALSGSGPAYVFMFIEALADAGVQLGFSRDVATKLAIETVRGSAMYAAQSPQHVAMLRNQVTSPGGTTAAGLFELEDGKLRATVGKAVFAAFKRAKELGEN